MQKLSSHLNIYQKSRENSQDFYKGISWVSYPLNILNENSLLLILCNAIFALGNQVTPAPSQNPGNIFNSSLLFNNLPDTTTTNLVQVHNIPH